MSEGQTQTTKLSSKWLFKMGIFALVGLGLGLWGVYDAFVAYPARGELVAKFEQLEYFDKADGAGRLYRASIDDPAAEHARLSALPAGSGLDDVEAARLGWLTELRKVRNLAVLTQQNQAMAALPPGEQTDTATRFIVPATARDELRAELQGKSQPPPLSTYDIPMQYGFVVLGFGVFGIIAWRFLRSAAQKYRYEASAHALTLPDGRTITPDMIELVDKRDWHKFYVYMKLKEKGEEIKLDLLRFTPLEAWILEMETQIDGYEPPAKASGGDDAGQQAAAPA